MEHEHAIQAEYVPIPVVPAAVKDPPRISAHIEAALPMRWDAPDVALVPSCLKSPAPAIAIAYAVELGGLSEDVPIALTGRVLPLHVPGIRSRSRLRDDELRAVRGTPSLKSPAPAFTIANTVELRGHHSQMEEPHAKVCPGNRAPPTEHEDRAVDIQELWNASGVESGGLQRRMKEPHARASIKGVPCTVETALASARPAVGLVEKRAGTAHPHMESTKVEHGGLQESSLSRDRVSGITNDEIRTWEHFATSDDPNPSLMRESSPSLALGATRTFSASSHSLPSVFSLVTAFTLVSVIVQKIWSSYLVRASRGELAPYRSWAREGIGTCSSI
jgi:hypothetical protein